MASGIFQGAKGIALGVVGITALYHSAKAVTLLASVVGKVFAMIEDKIRETDHTKTKKSGDDTWRVEDLLSVNRETWKNIGIQALKTVAFATASMYVMNRFFPSVVVDANTLLNRVLPIQFTSNTILKYAGI